MWLCVREMKKHIKNDIPSGLNCSPLQGVRLSPSQQYPTNLG